MSPPAPDVATESGPSSSSSLPLAPKLLARHEAHERHKASVEDAVDEEDQLHPPPSSNAIQPEDLNGSANDDFTNGTMSEKARGKRKMENQHSQKPTLDMQSEEMFPALGTAPKSRSAASAWGNKSLGSNLAAGRNGGIMNGNTSVSSPISSGTSTPASEVLTPSSPNVARPSKGQGAQKMVIPGQYNAEYRFETSQLNKTKSLKLVLDDIWRKSRVSITKRDDPTGVTFIASGPRDKLTPALKQLSKEIGVPQKVTVDVPGSIKSHVIGRQGTTIQRIMKQTGAKIQLPKRDGSGNPYDDSVDVPIEVEGDVIATAQAVKEIQDIIGKNAPAANIRLADIPPEFFPFIAGPNHSRIEQLQRGNDLNINVPQFSTWSHQPPPRVRQPDETPVFSPHPDMHIHITGDRGAAQQARAAIERHAEELRQQLRLREQTFQRGQHQFIVGERGMSPHDFLQETGCVVILPPSHEDTEDITIIGPADRLEDGANKASALAAELLSTSVDPQRYITNSPQGPSAHAYALAHYFRQRKLEEQFQRLHDAWMVFPASPDATYSWDIFSRDQRKLNTARAELVEIIRAHPPMRLALVEVDPFFHTHLTQRCAHNLRNDFGVHMIVPEEDKPGHVVLVHEGPPQASQPFRISKLRPTDEELQTSMKELEKARNHILSIIGDQQDISAREVEVPYKFHEKVRKFINREQQSDPPESFPVKLVFGESGRPSQRSPKPSQAAASGPKASLRGPGANVDDLEAKILAFLQQAAQEELERGYTTLFDFPSKLNSMLIGKQGSKINELREKYDVEIKPSDSGTVEIKGPKAKAEACKAEILALAKKWGDETTHKVQIDPKFHRDLIGRKGEDVNRLQEKYNVRIQFPRTINSNDDLSVTDSASDVGSARHSRSSQAPDEVIIRGPKLGADKAKNDLLELYQMYKDRSYTAKVSVSKKQIPSLMGRSGAEMDRLRAETGARIEVPNSQEVPEDAERVDIQIKGTQQSVKAAKEELQKRAKSYDDITVRTINVDKKFHQSLIGASGSNIKRIVSEAGGPENSAEAVKFPNRDSDSTTIRIEGTDLVVAKIVAALEKFVSEKENQVTETLEVPTGKHRMLIGRGGDIKRGLESQFKVQIEIPKNGSGRTGVKISGRSEGVAKAKAHISGMVKEQEGETVMVPKSVHHTIAQGGNFFRMLKNDHGVTVGHGGKKPPPRPEPPTAHVRTNGAPPPLITDQPDHNAHSWNLVVAEIPGSNSETIPWILSGPCPEKVAAAKAHLETALESSSQPSATGYLRLPSPKSHRLVIGPGGRNINAIRRKTGCDIQVPRAGNDERDGTIVITGPTEGCEEAKAMILDTVRNGDSH